MKTPEAIDDAELECELCGATWNGEHWSASDCNETGEGVTLCLRCAKRWDDNRGGPRLVGHLERGAHYRATAALSRLAFARAELDEHGSHAADLLESVCALGFDLDYAREADAVFRILVLDEQWPTQAAGVVFADVLTVGGAIGLLVAKS